MRTQQHLKTICFCIHIYSILFSFNVERKSLLRALLNVEKKNSSNGCLQTMIKEILEKIRLMASRIERSRSENIYVQNSALLLFDSLNHNLS